VNEKIEQSWRWQGVLFEKDLPKKFWVEVVNTAVFLLNRLPTRALQNKTTYEAWHGYKPSL
jgi:hypothetical protein